MSGKKLPGKPKLSKVKSFDECGCKIQNLEVDSVSTAFSADSRKAFSEVCNNSTIAKYCELKKGITSSKSTQLRLRNFFHAP